MLSALEMFIKGLKYFRWMRNYKIWFVLFFIILFFQVYLASRFLTLSKSIARSDLQNTIDVDDSDNSARKARPADDDEDTQASTTKTNNAKKLKSNATIHLRLEELDFTPACVIDNKEAVSAIYRAKTQTCKQLLANITCLSNADKLYPAELKGNCPADGFVFRKDLGCFKDEKEFRILSGYFGVNKKDNSPLYCIKLCLQSGFIYAGVQYSDECFCGNDEPPSTSKMPDSSCNMKCPGDGHATCGGYYTINVYQTGIKKFTPQVANTEIASTAPRVKIVFLLTLNGRAVRQVLRLIKNLYHKDHYYYIHVDIRQDYMFRELLKLEKLLPNVRLTRHRFATIWGGASLLRMLRSCMSELLTQPAWKWDFVLNLSESDFPVKTIAQLTDFLTANRDRNFVKSHGREVQRFIQKQGLDKTFVECETRMWRIGDRRLPLGVQLDGGSDWVALSYKFVQYVAADRPDSLISGLLLIFNHTLLPAESFFHTVLRNSKFCGSYVDNNLHVTNWKRKLGCKCQYKHIVDWCGCSPNDFKVEDWLRIQNTQTRQLYFARKFEPVISQAVILRLELWIRGLEKPPRLVENLDAYWQNLYHIKDLGESVDDGLLTLAYSVQRRVAKLLRNDSCSQEGAIGPVLQITSYHLKDNSKYTLFLIKTPEVNIEVAVKPINHLLAIHPGGLVKSLETFIVSSNYDQKEQLCRNFVRILSPYSEPTLMYRFGASFGGKAFNLTGLWIDPSGVLQDVTFSFVDENNLQGFAKAGLRPPLLPGNWTIKLLHKTTLLLQTSFLIIPLEFIGGSAISEIQAQLLHQPSEMHQHRKEYNNFLPNADEKQTLQNVAKSNANRYGVDLRDWIDSLTTKFYSVRKICGHFSEAVSLCGKTLEACVRSNWSSLAPDPKSAITLEQINSTTGMFDVW